MKKGSGIVGYAPCPDCGRVTAITRSGLVYAHTTADGTYHVDRRVSLAIVLPTRAEAEVALMQKRRVS